MQKLSLRPHFRIPSYFSLKMVRVIDNCTTLEAINKVNNNNIFLGIPYGSAGRFQRPTDFDFSRLSNVTYFNADKKAPSCFQNSIWSPEKIQQLFENGEITENCLTLDIYIPANAENAPIFFWIHGNFCFSKIKMKFRIIGYASIDDFSALKAFLNSDPSNTNRWL